MKRRKKGRKINGTNLALESWVAIAGGGGFQAFSGHSGRRLRFRSDQSGKSAREFPKGEISSDSQSENYLSRKRLYGSRSTPARSDGRK